MPRVLVFCGLYLFAARLGPAQVPAKGIELRLSGGYQRLSLGDFNTIHRDTQVYYDVLLSPYGFAREGRFSDLEDGWNLQLEFRLRLSRRIGIGLGVGYLKAETESTVDWRHSDLGEMELEGRLGLNAIPLVLTGYFTFLRSPLFDRYLFGGGGVCLLESESRYAGLSLIDGWGERFVAIYRSEDSGWGLHGGLGVEFKLGSSLRLFAEGTARWADISGLSGTATNFSTGSGLSSGGGDIWYFEYFDENLEQYLSGIQYGSRPEAEGLRDVHRLRIDLSGFVFRVGIRIALGSWD